MKKNNLYDILNLGPVKIQKHKFKDTKTQGYRFVSFCSFICDPYFSGLANWTLANLCLDVILCWSIFAKKVSLLCNTTTVPSWTDNNDPEVQKFAQLAHCTASSLSVDTAACSNPIQSRASRLTLTKKNLWGEIWAMDPASEATEQLNRAERFLTEIQENPEVIFHPCSGLIWICVAF